MRKIVRLQNRFTGKEVILQSRWGEDKPVEFFRDAKKTKMKNLAIDTTDELS